MTIKYLGIILKIHESEENKEDLDEDQKFNKDQLINEF